MGKGRLNTFLLPFLAPMRPGWTCFLFWPCVAAYFLGLGFPLAQLRSGVHLRPNQTGLRGQGHGINNASMDPASPLAMGRSRLLEPTQHMPDSVPAFSPLCPGFSYCRISIPHSAGSFKPLLCHLAVTLECAQGWSWAPYPEVPCRPCAYLLLACHQNSLRLLWHMSHSHCW